MKYMTIAIVGVVSVNAFTINDIKDAVKSQDFQPVADDVNAMIDGVVGDLKDKKTDFFDDLKDKIMDTDAYHKADDWYSNWEPTTYHDTQRWAQEHVKRVDKPEAHVMAEHRNVHHRVAERRAASGRPAMMTVAQIHNLGNKDTYKQTVDMWLQYDGIDNIANTMYSFFTGFIYTPGEQTVCSESILTYFSAWVNSIDTLKKVYLPYNWPNFQVVMQDIIASGSGLIQTCDVNKLFVTLTHMFTTEGLAELGARVAGAAPFELLQVIQVLGDKEEQTAEKARQVGKLCATLLNYHI